jgi:hypothetical protein
MPPSQVAPGSIYVYHDVYFNLHRDAPVPTHGDKVQVYQEAAVPRGNIPCCYVCDPLTGESLGLVPLLGLNRLVSFPVDKFPPTVIQGPCRHK